MSKKGIAIASAVAAALALGGCAQNQESMPHSFASQSGYSSKLGKLGHTHPATRTANKCAGNKCAANKCKAHKG